MPGARTGTIMQREARSTPAVIADMLRANDAVLTGLGADLWADPPAVVVTCARGSSDHAATYGKYLLETFCGVPVASAPPSVSSLYGAAPAARRTIMIAISQSGRSPDLLATVDAYKAGGAQIATIVNDETSPLAGRADIVLPLRAGEERAVAATKTCLASMVAMAALAARWSGDEPLLRALMQLPGILETALDQDWSGPLDTLADANAMMVIGRGFGLGIAQEAALKLKEICAIQAEPFSSAEVRHGPQRIIQRGYPLLGFAQDDSAGQDVRAAMGDFAARGAVCWTAGTDADLPVPATHPALQPIVMLAAFYMMADRLAARRGMDPDAPPHLRKVTETL